APTAPSFLPSQPPDYKPETRPHYPGGWGSGVGSQARCANTLAVSRRRGGRGRALSALTRFCLPRRVPSRVPRQVPRLTDTLRGSLRGTREGTLCGTPPFRKVHV